MAESEPGHSFKIDAQLHVRADRAPASLAGALAGGVLSYSSDQRQIARRAAAYVDRILKGAKPGEMPIDCPTRFELIVNLKARRTGRARR